MRIDDGMGTGKQAQVNNGNRLYTSAVTKTEDHDINEKSGKVWSIPFNALNPAGANDYVVYIKNTGDKAIEFSDIRVAASAATQLQLQAVSGTASGGTDITPVSRTVQGAAIPSAIIQSGTDITGLSDEGVIFFINCPVADTQYHLSTSSKIHIPKGKTIALLVENGSANVTGVISIYEDQN